MRPPAPWVRPVRMIASAIGIVALALLASGVLTRTLPPVPALSLCIILGFLIGRLGEEIFLRADMIQIAAERDASYYILNRIIPKMGFLVEDVVDGKVILNRDQRLRLRLFRDTLANCLEREMKAMAKSKETWGTGWNEGWRS